MAFNAVLKLGSLFFFFLVIAHTSGRAVEIQAEQDATRQGYGSERVIDRSNASNKKNVHLLAGESVSLYFCLPREDYVTINNVAFSNDGWTDNITVSIDGKQIGVLQSHDNSAWGFNWNVLCSSGKIGDRQNLVSGLHTITLKVEGGDKWGVELDSVSLTIEDLADDVDVVCTEEDVKAAGIAVSESVSRSLPKTGTADLESRSITNNNNSDADKIEDTGKTNKNNADGEDTAGNEKNGNEALTEDPSDIKGNTGIQIGCYQICS